jgi:hypothetical protein
MLKLSFQCTRFETNYSSCIGRSSGGAQEKGKTGWNSVYHQNWWFSEFRPPLNANVLFCFLNLILCVTKLRVPVLCFSYFMDNSSVFRLWLCITLCPWLRFKKVSWHGIHLLALSRASQHHRLVVWVSCEGVHQAVMLGELSVFN